MARWAFAIVVFAGALLAGGQALAASVSIADTWLPTSKYVTNKDIDGHGACYATSVINSFLYLQQRYPEIYDTKLTGTDPAAKRDALHKAIWDDVWTWEEAWEEKAAILEGAAKGQTVYKGWLSGGDFTGWDYSTGLSSKAPTWSDLWTEIEHQEDVELFFDWVADGKTLAHAVTLTSLETDSSGNPWRIDFIDPNTPGSRIYRGVKVSDGKLLLDYDGAGGTYEATIYGAFSESPVPLPSAVAMGAVLLVGLGVARRFRLRR